MDSTGFLKVAEGVSFPRPRVDLRYSVSAEGPDALEALALGNALVIDSFSFDDLLDLVGASPEARSAFSGGIALQSGGWQSWSAGWELFGRRSLPRRVLVVPELIKLTNRDGDAPGPGEAVGHFIMYLRVGERYLCLASREGGELPPVTWRVDRRGRRITAEVYASAVELTAGDAVAELSIFLADGYFVFKDTLRDIYRSEERFAAVSFLRSADGKVGGFESWYNHYTDIDEALILEDLEALDRTENLINRLYVRRGRPTVFQIDDGWERAVGDWEVNAERFPRGLRPVADRIEEKGYVPGLWLAPFLVTKRARLYAEKGEWLLRDASGVAVPAGFNDKWDNQYYCLDLSRHDVRDYLRSLIDRAIDEWGFRFLKLDFMYAGLLSGAFAEGGDAYEHYETACRILTARKRTESGAPVAYLGCGVPFGPSYRHFPLSRIGADTRETWDWPKVKLIRHVGRPSAYISLLDTIGRSYLDGTVFLNDPDVVFLRSENCALSETEKELVALTNYLLASQIMFSDDPARLAEGDVALTDRIVRLYDELAGDEYGAVALERDVYRLISRSGAAAGLINLRGRSYRLDPEDPLAARLPGAEPLVDHRLGGTGSAVFARRSISIYRTKD